MKKNMLNWVACLGLLLGGFQTASAQESEEAPKYHLGVRIGYSETNVWHDLHLDGHGDRNRQSFVGGINFDTRLIKNPLYFETGLYGSNRGVDVRDGSRRYAANNFSLLVPAALSYHFYPNRNFGISPLAGVFAAYNFGFKTMDYGFRLGCGFNYKQVNLNFGCDLGIKDDMFENKDGWAESDGRLTSIFVTLGWNFLGNR